MQFIPSSENGSLEVKNGESVTVATISEAGTLDLSGEIQQVTTGSAHLVPIAYGVIDSDGTVLSGTGNFTAVLENYFYNITINDHMFSENSYTVQVSRIGFSGAQPTYDADNGTLEIQFVTDNPFVLEHAKFSFVVFKP